MEKTLCESTLEVEYVPMAFRTPETDLDERSFWGPERWVRIKQQAEKLGLTIKKPVDAENSLIARRAFPSYTGVGLQEYIHGVLRAVFRDGIDISNPRAFMDYLQSEGVDVKPIIQSLEDPATEARALQNDMLWIKEKLRILPTFSLGSERYAGMIDGRGLENFILRYL